MLLIQKLLSLSPTASSAALAIAEDSAFYEAELGVPALVGLEYMGQTAALIAGYQQEQGLCQPQLGFLLGSRDFVLQVPYFLPGQHLRVSAEQGTLVGQELANFICTIHDAKKDTLLCEATLSVMRKPLAEPV